jgi:hypothetical protein
MLRLVAQRRVARAHLAARVDDAHMRRGDVIVVLPDGA